jgi:UDP-glucose 4-epimerase
LNLLDAARKSGVRRVVYAASSSAYGGASGAAGQTEDQLPAAKSPYAAAKLAGELYMQAFAATYGIETVRVRFFNIFGPRQRADSPYSGVIALFTAAMARGEMPTVQGDGLQSRDFTFVANAVHALRCAAEAPAAVSGNVYNVGTGRSVTILDLIRELNGILGTDLQPTFGPSRVGDVRYSLADISRTQRELSYNAVYTFEAGLKETVEWYFGTIGKKLPTARKASQSREIKI